MSKALNPGDLFFWLRGRLFPAEHFQQKVFKGTTPALANTNFIVRHDLNRTLAGTGPNGDEQGAEFIWWLDGAGSIYVVDPGDENQFTVRCTEPSRGYTIIVR